MKKGIEREFISILMESPLYFTLSVKERYILLARLSEDYHLAPQAPTIEKKAIILLKVHKAKVVHCCFIEAGTTKNVSVKHSSSGYCPPRKARLPVFFSRKPKL